MPLLLPTGQPRKSRGAGSVGSRQGGGAGGSRCGAEPGPGFSNPPAHGPDCTNRRRGQRRPRRVTAPAAPRTHGGRAAHAELPSPSVPTAGGTLSAWIPASGSNAWSCWLRAEGYSRGWEVMMGALRRPLPGLKHTQTGQWDPASSARPLQLQEMDKSPPPPAPPPSSSPSQDPSNSLEWLLPRLPSCLPSAPGCGVLRVTALPSPCLQICRNCLLPSPSCPPNPLLGPLRLCPMRNVAVADMSFPRARQKSQNTGV